MIYNFEKMLFSSAASDSWKFVKIGENVVRQNLSQKILISYFFVSNLAVFRETCNFNAKYHLNLKAKNVKFFEILNSEISSCSFNCLI